jgi:uncharacterized protein YndB with AHSA1/START domain
LSLVRTLDAPPGAVFEAWTDPAIMREWFAPGEVQVAEARSDPRVGGAYLIRMQTPDGEHPTVSGEFREVIRDRRLVFTWQWQGSEEETLVTVGFEALPGGRTQLTLTHERFAQEEARDKHEHGWGGCLAKLGARFEA